MRAFKKLLVPFIGISFGLLVTLFAWHAWAQDAAAAAPSTDLAAAVGSGNEVTLLQSAWNALTHGQYAPAIVILLIAAVWFVRMDHTKIPVVGALIDKTFGKLVRWSRSDRGGVVAVFVTSILGGVLHTLSTGGTHALSWGTLKVAMGLGVVAIGGFTGVKRLFSPSDTDAVEVKPVIVPPAPPPGA